jgi:multiple sugar transport system ATP-binding protein
MSELEVEGLTRRFGDVTAVAELSMTVPAGEFLVLLGPSGCGKTTLLRMLAGLLEPTEGRILLGGEDITWRSPQDRDLAMVFQSYALYPHLTVERNLGFGLKARKLPREERRRRVQEVAGLLELGELMRRKPKDLSGGQRQRVALGRAIVRHPKAFLMDEPLSNLDAKLRGTMRTELIKLHRRLATTFVYVTHDQVDAMTMASRVAVLNHGRLEQLGTPVEVYDEPASVFVAGFFGSPPMNLVPAEVVTADGGMLEARSRGLRVPLWEGSAPRRAVTLGVRPEHLAVAAADHDGPAMRGIVDVVENLGNEEIAFCTTPGGSVAIRGPRPLGLALGQAVTLSARPEHFHLFDETSGRRLRWHSPALSAVPTA